MNNKILMGIIGILLAIVAGLTTVIVKKTDKFDVSETHKEEPALKTQSEQESLVSQAGEPLVNLTPDNIRLSAIEVTALSSTSKETTQEAYAEVLDISTLMSDIARYNQFNTEIAKAKISIQQAQQNFARNKLLNSDDHNVSDQVLQSSESELRNAQVALTGLITEKDNLWQSLRLNWGNQLINQSNLNQGMILKLLNNQMSLLRVTVPKQAATHSLPQFITINTQSGIRKIRVLGASPRANENLLGISVLAISDDILPMGMKFTASFPQGSTSSGVVVPTNAIIWWQGGSWVYKQISSGHFQRVSLGNSEEISEGYFVKNGLVSGDQIVTQGAQLILSKEQRDTASAMGSNHGGGDDE